MGEEVKKPLSVSEMLKKKLPPWFPAEVLWFSLLAALVAACVYGGYAAYSLSGGTPSCKVLPCYEVKAADINPASAILNGLMWCSAPQGAAAALALLLKGRCRRSSRVLSFIALAAAAVNYALYAWLLVLARASTTVGALLHACDVASLLICAVLDVLGLLALLLGAGEEEKS